MWPQRTDMLIWQICDTHKYVVLFFLYIIDEFSLKKNKIYIN